MLLSHIENAFSPASNEKSIKTWFSFGERLNKLNVSKENTTPLMGSLTRLDKHLTSLVFIEHQKLTIADLYLFSILCGSFVN